MPDDKKKGTEEHDSEKMVRPNRTGGQAEGEREVYEEKDTDTPLERKRPSQAEG
jgi:hypothetical protein